MAKNVKTYKTAEEFFQYLESKDNDWLFNRYFIKGQPEYNPTAKEFEKEIVATLGLKDENKKYIFMDLAPIVSYSAYGTFVNTIFWNLVSVAKREGLKLNYENICLDIQTALLAEDQRKLLNSLAYRKTEDELQDFQKLLNRFCIDLVLKRAFNNDYTKGV